MAFQLQFSDRGGQSKVDLKFTCVTAPKAPNFGIFSKKKASLGALAQAPLPPPSALKAALSRWGLTQTIKPTPLRYA